MPYKNRFGRTITGIKGKPQPGAKGGSSYRRDRKYTVNGPEGILGALPDAPVFRGGGAVPFRGGPSKIRDPLTGLLIPTPALTYENTIGGPGGERLRSTRYFKAEADKYKWLAVFGNRKARRQLALIRKSCALFMKAVREGVDLDTGRKAKPRKLVRSRK